MQAKIKLMEARLEQIDELSGDELQLKQYLQALIPQLESLEQEIRNN